MAEVINFPVWVRNNDTDSGVKYNSVKSMDIAEIAKLIRADIKSAIKAGQIPQGKYSVKISRFSGGRSLNVRIADIDVDFLNVERIKRLKQGFDYHEAGPRYTNAGQEILNRVLGIVNAYNYDRSDSQIDYFDVSFYSGVDFDHEFENNAKRRIEAEIAKSNLA